MPATFRTASRRVAAPAALAVPLLGLCALPVTTADAAPPQPAQELPLGPAGLVETRSTQALQPGVTLTSIVRGAADAATFWTVEVQVPAGGSAGGARAALGTAADARALAARLAAAGLEPRVEPVETPATADFAGGVIGHRVRVGQLATQAQASAVQSRLGAAGFPGASTVFTGWDGAPTDRGPWKLQVLTVDPRAFTGSLVASYGPDLRDRETTSALGRAAGATAAVNAGYFVLDTASGAPGDPAGAGVYDGELQSEPVGDRPVLVVREGARGTRVARVTWDGSVLAPRGTRLALDGVNRVPGLIRNCGGTADDAPVGSAPRHDTTCTDPDELVAFTAAYGPTTPAGAGVEAVLDAHQRVVAVRSPRGGALPPGGRSVQATGTQAAALRAVATVGKRLRLQATLRDEDGRVVRHSAGTSVVNGGPELVRDGDLHVTVARDGMVRPNDPSFYYGWAAKRNPRTLAGVDAYGRTVLVTADGRSTASLGLSIPEAAQVAKALGLRDALNLDGGGSTTMVARGAVVNTPSDAGGAERPVGDALLVLPPTPSQRRVP
ncbi:phosphodiester glycosidase family protein [Motilibacter aurantiacus]|uniref:phosphodiester glycosidase family protein n=1 Tax=Motilibacter aurantiacus TaxID=2714955 RepID=UPI00140D389B|nr:phosphodiester glycosidase family protein [Motilibacter aurantiacus]NHC43698.1 phosphodiester glycosidase family protein [Motilibacter aurantiacus]